MELIIRIILNVVGFYMFIGAVFSIAFLWKGIDKVDKAAAGTSRKFRFLLFPGLLIFWPIFLIRWNKIK